MPLAGLPSTLTRHRIDPDGMKANPSDRPGLGVEIETGSHGRRIGHEGNNDGRCAAYCATEPDTGDALVILTNDGAGFGVYQRMVRAITGRDQYSFIANENPPLPA